MNEPKLSGRSPDKPVADLGSHGWRSTRSVLWRWFQSVGSLYVDAGSIYKRAETPTNESKLEEDLPMKTNDARALSSPSRTRLATLIALCGLMAPAPARANPYLAKPGEAPVTARVATCAISGGFTHLYTAMDNGLFDKYGFKVSHSFIAGGSAALAALASDDIQFLYCAADATLPGLATGVDGKLVAAPLIGLPYVLISRKEINRVEDLKGSTSARRMFHYGPSAVASPSVTRPWRKASSRQCR